MIYFFCLERLGLFSRAAGLLSENGTGGARDNTWSLKRFISEGSFLLNSLSKIIYNLYS